MKRNENLFLKDIISYIDLIENSIKNLTKKKFKKDKVLFDATIYRLEIIGEASKNISVKTRKKYYRVSWKKTDRIIDIIAPEFFTADLDALWEVVKEDLPLLKKHIKEILEKEKHKLNIVLKIRNLFKRRKIIYFLNILIKLLLY